MTQGSTRRCMVMEEVPKYCEFKYACGLYIYSALQRFFLKKGD